MNEEIWTVEFSRNEEGEPYLSLRCVQQLARLYEYPDLLEELATLEMELLTGMYESKESGNGESG